MSYSFILGLSSSFHQPKNDGTNACVFLALKIGEQISRASCGMQDLCSHVEKVIENYPILINKHRNINRSYEITEACELLLEKNLIKNVALELKSKDLPLFSPEGMEEFHDTFGLQGVFLVTTPPYTFLVWKTKDDMRVVDTHAVSKELGGNGNAIVISFQDVKSGVTWISKRLVSAGVKDSFQQIYCMKADYSITNK